jgi:hypothetical protein
MGELWMPRGVFFSPVVKLLLLIVGSVGGIYALTKLLGDKGTPTKRLPAGK